jgi:hypothetical protein
VLPERLISIDLMTPLFCAVVREIFSYAYFSLAFFGSFFGNAKKNKPNEQLHFFNIFL